MQKYLRQFFMAATLFIAAPAFAVPVVYDITSYASGNFSASWLHSADGCESGGLYMCAGNTSDSFQTAILGGVLYGDYAGGELSNIGGVLVFAPNAAGWTGLELTGGALGGSGDWYLDYNLFGGQASGRFLFESMNMGAGGPNAYSLQDLVLWGQNESTYANHSASYVPSSWLHTDNPFLGLDLYGELVSSPTAVSEPSTLGLLLAGLGLVGWRRRQSANR